MSPVEFADQYLAILFSYEDKKEFVPVPDGDMAQGTSVRGMHILAFSGDNAEQWKELGFIALESEDSGDCSDRKQEGAEIPSPPCFAWHGTVTMSVNLGQDWPEFMVHITGTTLGSHNELVRANDAVYHYHGKQYRLLRG